MAVQEVPISMIQRAEQVLHYLSAYQDRDNALEWVPNIALMHPSSY